MRKTPLVSYDHDNMLAAAVGKGGTTPDEFDALMRGLGRVRTALMRGRDDGTMAFLRAPEDAAAAKKSAALAKDVRAEFTTLVVCGTGGSSLGSRAILEALNCAARPKLGKACGMDVRFVGDNVDPDELSVLLADVDWKRTAVNVISKSGDTVETMATFFILRDAMARAIGEKNVARRVVATTDPSKGALRAMAEKNQWRTLDFPTAIGGRYAALTAVGLFPAACAGLDPATILAGARDALARAFDGPLGAAGPLLFAGLHQQAYVRRFQHVTVMMPYSASLHAFADWFRQLWAESLGKAHDRNGHPIHYGLTPIAALGPSGQHSELQLWNEGPYDKTITFVEVDRFANDAVVPKVVGKEFAALAGKKLSDILHAARAATAATLASHGRANGTVRIPALTEEAVGGLLMFFMIATAAMGEMLNIDAFDQPGVEEGKRIIREMLAKKK